MRLTSLKIFVLVLFILMLFGLNLLIGSVNVPFRYVMGVIAGNKAENELWNYIVIENRLPQALTALCCGGALSASGLMLQTAFRNPLAGPGIFGINSGAALAVAIVMLFLGGSVSIETVNLNGFTAILFASFAGAMAVTFIILAFSTRVRNNVSLLIIGIMIGYLASSVISLLNFFATDQGVKSYLIWGLGSFGGVSLGNIPFFCTMVLVGLVCSLVLVKPLNALTLGEQYAQSLGVNVARTRFLLLAITGFLTAVTTAFCGPIAFIGLAVPHLARLLTGTEDHRTLLPATILLGCAVALLCSLLCYLPPNGSIIPINAITPLIGAPVIVYIMMKRRG
jgi:iron compound ABC transporter, permease protein